MNLWTFKCFLKNKSGDDVVEAWYNDQTAEVRAAFDSAINFLSQQTRWQRPQIGTLTEECSGLIEIRFKAGRKQHRPLGCYGGEKVFIFLLPEVVEKDSKFVPKDACAIAKKRKDIIDGDKDHVQICEFES